MISLEQTIRPCRLMKMNRTSNIGWGYGDFVRETVGELEQILG